ncbi:MAG: 16S rRNA (guanine(966)-N(2))-methyltransferase RsmD [Acetobacter papayae]
MRIIAGSRRGRMLHAPTGSTTRPTADRVRQALFDMLLHAPWGGLPLLEGAHVLDAFAGTGALGLEALSRGAEHVTFFETDRAALAALRANIHACGWESRTTVIPRDVAYPRSPNPEREPARLVFLDPPYRLGLPTTALRALRDRGWLAPEAIVVAETARDEALPFAPPEEETQAVDTPPQAQPRQAPMAQAAAGQAPAIAVPRRNGLVLEALGERQHGAARLSIWRL